MRTSAITVLGLAAAALLSLVSFTAKAAPISVDVQACTITSGHWCDSGSSTYTNGGVTFQGWEKTGEGFGPANLTYKNGGADEVGLGVLCTYNTTDDKCGEHEINTAPFQYISATIPTLSSLSIGVQSVDSGGGGENETAYIYLWDCANFSACATASSPFPLDSYTFNGTNKTWTFNFTAAELSGYGYLYISPVAPTGGAPDANILLSSFSYQPVPEPAALGMFGLGVLLIGALVGSRRRLG